MKITTLRMPDALHKQIRRQALETKTKTEITSKGYICPMCYEKREKKNDRR